MTKDTVVSVVDLRMMLFLDDLNRSQLAWATPESFREVEFIGFHKFRADDGSEYGSFEVFFSDGSKEGTMELEKGWYWWACLPGCLPDSYGDEPANGPFPTAEGAYLDALEGGHG